MNIPGIPGDSNAEQFENWFEVMSWSWGETNANSSFGGGGGAGRVQMSDFNVMKRAGKGSPLLMLACASGRHLPAVQIVMTVERGDRQMVFERFVLSNAAITSYQLSGDGSVVPSESMSLNFTRIEFTQTYQNDQGAPQSQTAFWDLQANRGG
jgi:type VI secretion system secreted protein Hcp